MMTLTREGEFTAVHSQQGLPSWHECHHPHGHRWTVRLEVVAKDNLTEDESVAVHTALAEFDTWVDAELAHQYLNKLDDSLTGNCSPWELGRWIFATWSDRVPHLAAVHVQGPLKDGRSRGSVPGGERYEVTYRPEDDPRYGRYPLHNDAIEVAEVVASWGELWMGPDGARTVETVRNVKVRFVDGHQPYARWHGGNVLTDWAAPDAQLLRVESVSFEYRYTTWPAPVWWSGIAGAETLYANESGQVIEPRRERSLATMGMGEGVPAWVRSLERAHRPAAEEVPPPPPSAARS
ncbi:6-pyruvoyl trahydropterin synthase family protein [Streptomyces sp. GQFP]|uniref:6-pyruvoyl trahydropterin synthase family protein n=1 Tax=Streptomyces sp. GQFP TaxID=2907545 RepID=UPI001F2E04F8|nr:6-carboxytetrahydropterin synthase [Streptomyces sp. GQFP]UIX34452.1 6-carboxytetrahydropterin synthase [Streptomyces sp. GQFP]